MVPWMRVADAYCAKPGCNSSGDARNAAAPIARMVRRPCRMRCAFVMPQHRLGCKSRFARLFRRPLPSVTSVPWIEAPDGARRVGDPVDASQGRILA
jgi:hypothetical protein